MHTPCISLAVETNFVKPIRQNIIIIVVKKIRQNTIIIIIVIARNSQFAKELPCTKGKSYMDVKQGHEFKKHNMTFDQK